MNQLTNIQTINTQVNVPLLLEVFQKYSIVSSMPIDYVKLVKDIINVTTVDKVYVFDSGESNYSL